ncbi:MAG: pyocin activator PrtN family protein [Vibrio sp.]
MSSKQRAAIFCMQFGPEIAVKDICQRYFNLTVKTANERIKSGKFPLPAFRTANTNSGDYFVKAEDLAELIEAQHSKAKAEWEAARSH